MKPWVVVNFNAWQHQRIDPPWWSLLDTVFRDGRRKLALWTIVSLRWPILAEFLVTWPDVADVLANPPADSSALEKALRSHLPRGDATNEEETTLVDLMKSQGVLKVFNARDMGTKLDADAVRRLSALSSTAGIGAAPIL